MGAINGILMGVYAVVNGSEQLAHMHSLIRTFASRYSMTDKLLNIISI